MIFPKCRWGEKQIGDKRKCKSPKIHAISLVSPKTCEACCYKDHEPEEQQVRKINKLCLHFSEALKVYPPIAPDNLRDWRECEKGHGIVCPCKNCGPKCSDYEVSE